MYVVRREFSEDDRHGPQNKGALMLRSLDRPSLLVSFKAFSLESEARKTDGELYQLLFSVRGRYSGPPTHAVFAEWNLIDPSLATLFEESRRHLFKLRRDVLETFVIDWLLRLMERGTQYVVLGLYGDEEGATVLCREHPKVREFVHDHPPEQYRARDVTGLRSFRIESGTGLE